MSAVFDEILQEGIEQGIGQGIEQGTERTLVASVRNLVETLGLSVVEAMKVLKIPEADQPRYLAML